MAQITLGTSVLVRETLPGMAGGQDLDLGMGAFKSTFPGSDACSGTPFDRQQAGAPVSVTAKRLPRATWCWRRIVIKPTAARSLERENSAAQEAKTKLIATQATSTSYATVLPAVGQPTRLTSTPAQRPGKPVAYNAFVGYVANQL